MRNRKLWGILAVALVLRAALLAAGWGDVRHFMTPDSEDYLRLAIELKRYRSFSDRVNWRTETQPAPPPESAKETGSILTPPRDGETYFADWADPPLGPEWTVPIWWNRDPTPELFRTPGYPLFLAGVYALTGDPYCRAALPVQILLDVLLVAVTFSLARRLCGERVALWAAGFQAVTPAAIVSSVRILSDGPFALLLSLGILLLVIHFQDRRWWAIPFAGVCIGAAALVRPIGGPYIAVLTVFILIASIRRPQWALVFALCAGAFVAPWMARNYIVTHGEYWQLSSVGDYNLRQCNVMAFAEADGKPGESEFIAVMFPSFGVEMNDPGSLKAGRQTAMRIIRMHPFRYAWFHFRTSLNCFLPAATDVLEVAGVTSGNKGTLAVIRNQGLAAGVRHYFGGRTWPIALAAPMVLLLLVQYLAAIVGAIRHVRLRMGPAGWLILITILYYVFVPGPVAHARFRVPICPLLSILAAAGVVWIIDRLRQRQSRKQLSPQRTQRTARTG